MKKSVLILLSLVLICTMCAGFVACVEDDKPNIDNSDDGQEQNNVPVVPPAPIVGLSKYIVGQQFSFGTCRYEKIESDYSGIASDALSTILNDAEYIIFDPDNAFSNTLSAIQLSVDEHSETLLGVDSSSEDYITVNLHSEVVDNSAIVTARYTTSLPENAENIVANLEKGKVEPYTDSICLSGDIIHEIYKVGDYVCVYGSRISGFEITFYTYIYHKDMDRIFQLYTDIYFDFKHEAQLYVFDQIFKQYASIEERHDIAQYYQPIHKEIMTSWMNVEEGKKYLEQFQ